MRIAEPSAPEQVDLDTRRAVAELQRAARANAGQAEVLARLVVGLFGAAGNTTRPIALIRRSAPGSLVNATDTIMDFDPLALVDTDNMFDASLPNRLTVQTPGIYFSAASNNFAANSTGIRILDILALGTNPVTNVIGATTDNGIGTVPNIMQAVGAPVPLDAGSPLYLNLYQTSGGPLATGGTWFAAIYLQPMS